MSISISHQESQLFGERVWRRDALYGWVCVVHICDDEKTGKPVNLETLVDIRGNSGGSKLKKLGWDSRLNLGELDIVLF